MQGAVRARAGRFSLRRQQQPRFGRGLVALRGRLSESFVLRGILSRNIRVGSRLKLARFRARCVLRQMRRPAERRSTGSSSRAPRRESFRDTRSCPAGARWLAAKDQDSSTSGPGWARPSREHPRVPGPPSPECRRHSKAPGPRAPERPRKRAPPECSKPRSWQRRNKGRRPSPRDDTKCKAPSALRNVRHHGPHDRRRAAGATVDGRHRTKGRHRGVDVHRPVRSLGDVVDRLTAAGRSIAGRVGCVISRGRGSAPNQPLNRLQNASALEAGSETTARASSVPRMIGPLVMSHSHE